jgi:hypothetical protein
LDRLRNPAEARTRYSSTPSQENYGATLSSINNKKSEKKVVQNVEFGAVWGFDSTERCFRLETEEMRKRQCSLCSECQRGWVLLMFTGFLKLSDLVRKKPYFEQSKYTNIYWISLGVGNVPRGHQRLLFAWGFCVGDVLVHARLGSVDCVWFGLRVDHEWLMAPLKFLSFFYILYLSTFTWISIVVVISKSNSWDLLY